MAWRHLVCGAFICLGVAFGSQAADPQPARNLAAARSDDGAAFASQRVALVIGNSAYKSAPLANPVNDARDIAKALAALGFEVFLKENATQRTMKQGVRELSARIRQGGTGLVYFAGHGIQSRGKNYLIPVDADIGQEYELDDQAVDTNLILAAMEEARNPVNILILDACRNNPFARSFRSASRGLAQLDAAKGTLIAYATAPGSVAADGSGRNGIYTKNLLTSLRLPDSDIARVFARTRAAVARETNGLQIPWESTSLIGDFYFNPRQAPDATATSPNAEAAPVSALALEISFWESIQQSRNRADFDAYLNKYPQGQYAELARIRMDALDKVATAAPTVSDERANAGMATVHFYRTAGFMGWGSTSVVSVKGRELGQLSNGSYFTARVPAGPQVVAVEHGEWAGSRVFDFEPGATYYIKFEYSLGRVNLAFAAAQEASEAIKSLPDSAATGPKN